MPKCCKCLKYGHYCGVYVWVLPGGEDELTKLTLTILDFAVNLPATPIVVTKTVVYNVGPDGLPIAKGKEVGTVSATIPIDTPSLSVLKADITQAANTLELQIEAAKAEVANLPPNHPRMAPLNALISRAGELPGLRQQAASIPAAPTLPAPYVPSIDVIGGPGLIQLQNRLQSVQPTVPLLVPPPG
jgi:hypothetical protein